MALSTTLPFTVMPGLDPGIQGRKSGSRWPLDARVKPGDDRWGERRSFFHSPAGKAP
jgi:hypothetical protein